MSEVDITNLLAEAAALLNDNGVKPPPEPKLKLNSIKPKKKPVIKSGNNYHYDPKTYNDLHKVSNWHLINDAEDAIRLNDKLFTDYTIGLIDAIAVDTETYPLTQYSVLEVPEQIVRKYVKKHANDLPFGITICDGRDSWFITDGLLYVKQILESNIPKILANAKYDMHMLENLGIKLGGRKHDVQIMIKLFNENFNSYKLKDLAVKFIDKESNKWEIMKDNWMAENKTNDWRAVPEELMADYGAGDGWFTFLLYKKFNHYMDDFEVRELYDRECRLLDVAYRMERIGFKCDRDYLEKAKYEFKSEIAAMYAEIYALAGGIINVNSAQQLEKFFLAQGVRPEDIKKTDKGNASFDKDEMKKLAKKYSIANKIQDVKKMEKLLSSYIINILNTLPKSDRTHCSINTMEAVTGRMSITDPALQTLPKKDKRIRKAFIPKPGCALFFFDLDQIEYRGFAHYSQDPNLIQSIHNGWDVHSATAAIINNKKYEEIDPDGDERSRAKTINFALIYGVGNEHLAEMLGVSEDEARQIKSQYFAKLPKAKVFLNTVQETTKNRGYIRNSFMRRRRLNKDEVYKAPNALLQSWAADFIKSKMIHLADLIKDYKTEMVNIVHDEIIFEVPYDEIETIAPLIKATIDDLNTFRVPITCGCEFSMTSWGAKINYDLTKSLDENIDAFKAKYGEVA